MAVTVVSSQPIICPKAIHPQAVVEPFQRFGLPTPPASPDTEYARPPSPQQVRSRKSTSSRHPTPESRLGKCLGRIQLRSILGVGAYGVVYKAVDVSTLQVYAVKALSKFNADGSPLDQRQQDFQRREISLHYQASAHPNVVSMHKIIDDLDCTYVVMEYCSEGDLFSNITERCRYSGNEDLIRSVALQILDAVAHCHRLGIYHRDLKPENILVANQGRDVMLADFGLATTDLYSVDFGCGSTFYMSPECQDQSPRSPWYACAPNDVWSLGVILVNLTCGRNPWKQASSEDSTFREYLKDRQFLKTILPLSEEFDSILARVFELSPARRISLDELRWRILTCRQFVDNRPASQRCAPRRSSCQDLFTPPTSPGHMSPNFPGFVNSPFAVPQLEVPMPGPVLLELSSSSSSSSSSTSSVDTMMSDRSDNSIGSLPEELSEPVAVSPQATGYGQLSPIEEKAPAFYDNEYASYGQAHFDNFSTPEPKANWHAAEAAPNTFFMYPYIAPCTVGY